MTTIERVELDQVPLLARPYFAEGDPGPIVRALAQVPELLVATLPFVGAALGPSAIDFRSKEIVIVRTSALAGCRYCVQTHAVVALEAGLSTAEVAALQGTGPAEDAFPVPHERALVRWVDVVAGGGPVSDDDRAAVLASWTDHEVVELTTVVGATLMLNRFATALALPTAPDAVERLAQEGLL